MSGYFQNYYANKQEDHFYMLKSSYKTSQYVLTNTAPSENGGVATPFSLLVYGMGGIKLRWMKT